MGIFDKVKDLFGGGKKETPKIDNSNKLLDIIKNSGISDENLKFITRNGTSEEEITKALKEIFYFKKKNLSRVIVEDCSVFEAFQIAKVLGMNLINFVKNPGVNIDRYYMKTKIKYQISGDINKDFNGLIICSKSDNIEGQKISINGNGLCFLKISDKNIGEIINTARKNEEIIGFTSSNSVLDAHLYGVKQMIYNICQNQPSKNRKPINEMELVKKFQNLGGSVSVDFNEILFSLEKVDELASSNMLQSMGVNITPEMKVLFNRQKAIIHAMTEKEKCRPEIIDSARILRIARGSGTTVDMVTKLVSMIDLIKKNGPKMAANMMNPAAMFNMNK